MCTTRRAETWEYQMNSASLTGNLTRDPELRFTSGARATASFGLAVNRRYQQNGEWKEDVSFFNVTCWGDLAENVCGSFSKGDRVMVSGRLDQRTWDDKTTGDKRSAVELVAEEVGASVRWATVKVTKVTRESAPASAPATAAA